MAQVFGIIGFFLAVIAVFIASEAMRRASRHILELETTIYKLTGRIQKLEGRLLNVEKATNLSESDRRRQKETLLALEKKTRAQKPEIQPGNGGDGDRYTPSQYRGATKKTLGIG